jgi:DNA-binding PadR family transcriptional regulator
MKEPELRERVLVMLPTLRDPSFKVIQAQFSSRLKRGVLDRTLRHMCQEELIVPVMVTKSGHSVRCYRLTQTGLTERARLVLSKRRRAS